MFSGPSITIWDNISPISAELFGPERFEQHAHSLAKTQTITSNATSVYSVVRRLDDNAAALLQIYRDIGKAVEKGKTVTPAAEWLVDNYYLVEEQISQTRDDLPERFYRQLPKLIDGPLQGHPRIFGAVWAYVAHTDSRFDPITFSAFLNAYQTIAPFTIGEVWASAISLRLILIENLRRLSQRMNNARMEREAADAAADSFLNNGLERDPSLAFKKIESISIPFAVQLLQRMRDLDDDSSSQALKWLQSQLVEQGHTIETAVADEHHRQAAANVTVRNIVQSMRLVDDINWETWFDGVSIVEKSLLKVSSYEEMDFKSRNLYRTAVEELARGSNQTEINIVERVIDKVSHAEKTSFDAGQWLIGSGRNQLEKEIGFRPSFLKRLRNFTNNAGLSGYLGAAAILVFLIEVSVFRFSQSSSISTSAMSFLIAAAILPASEIAFSIVNLTLSRLLDTRMSPGLALRGGVPEKLRTLVAIPCLLTSAEGAEELLNRLEVHFLSSGPGELYFALVTDWLDSNSELTDTDLTVLERARFGIEDLNRRYDTCQFILLHRQRSFDPKQNKWLGWERKRGKLHELNRLLRGAVDTNFRTIVGIVPANVRYVITLDADTRLPRDAARKLIGKMAHPLNTPLFDPAKGLIVSGHGILQPRVTASLPTGHVGSYFQRIFSTARGIDPYIFAASDLYQDLFDEGSFTGKGIYDVDAFESATAGRIPDNAVLSHDLFEGVLVRSGLASDVEVIDDFPEQYEVSAARQHRWARGDWQLLPWILGLRNSGNIPPLGRWKMIDNLRRTLVPIAQLIILIAGWTLLNPSAAAIWTAGILLSIFIPVIMPTLVDGFHITPRTSARLHLSFVKDNLTQAFALGAAQFVLLVNQAILMADAILRTLFRLIVSKKNLLEWTTAAQMQAMVKPGIWRSYSQLSSAPAIGIIVLMTIVMRGIQDWYWATPFAIVWLAAPAIAHWLSISTALEDELSASEFDRRSLRVIARRTYRYFEQFVTASENMLPPDNFQEDPKAVIAHRTSPTNIGLYLLSTASARELGWIGLAQAVEKIESSFNSIQKLEKFRGHLFNWYDTESLIPLEPRYISSVDSGNLAGHLIALANCLEAWGLEAETAAERSFGIDDILEILVEEVKNLPKNKSVLNPMRKGFLQQIEAMKATLQKARAQPELFSVRLIEHSLLANKIFSTAARIAAETSGDSKDSIIHWSNVLRSTVDTQFQDVSLNAAQIVSINQRLVAIATSARNLAYGMEFGFLFDEQRNLLTIGYRVNERMQDESCYDMLASEARLASFFAISKGDLPTRHWFRLGRTLTEIRGGAALVSWSGSMFEYLMPALVMRGPSNGMLDQTAKLIVARQIEYAKGYGIPWGISESAFSARDVGFTYQYSNFGVPGLGLKRGLSSNLVIAPYATGLATMVAPRLATRNYENLKNNGSLGAYGHYEAVDYTPARLQPGEDFTIIRAYFAHHQGMTIVAILNAVKSGMARDWFHNEPRVRATELLLQERAPRDVLVSTQKESIAVSQVIDLAPTEPRVLSPFTGNSPQTQLLSNGQFTTMLTAAGSGYSSWNGLAITRWQEDSVEDSWGQFMYLREPRAKNWWSATHMPAKVSDNSTAIFSEHQVEFARTEGIWKTTLECIISPESNSEARRLTIENKGLTARDLEITSFAELVLSTQSADSAHPAFSKLFIETEFVAGVDALVATRRKRSPTDPDIWVAQIMLTNSENTSPLEYETDRSRFIGRCRDVCNPQAMDSVVPLSNTTGTVLDPILALRRRIRVPRARKAAVTFWTLVASSREAVLDLVDHHSQSAAFDRALMMAWTQGQIQLRHLSIKPDEADLFQELGSSLIYANASMRSPNFVMANDIGAQSELWPLSISGDRPIILLRIDTIEDIEIIRQMVRAFEYWKSKRLAVDLVILNDRRASYVQDLQLALDALVRKLKTPNQSELSTNAGDVFILRADIMPQTALKVLAASARIVIYARRGSLAVQLSRLRSQTNLTVSRPKEFIRPAKSVTRNRVNGVDKIFYNGSGGFSENGEEYVIYPTADKPTIAPWTNVIANSKFGFHTSSDGAGYTWVGNSKEMQLTPWRNDPISNKASEAFYVTDMDSGTLSSPTQLPLRDQSGNYVVRHGFGYTVFEREVDQLKMELSQYVPLSDSVKISKLRIYNRGTSTRSLAITFYAEWVLGTSRSATSQFITTEIDSATGALVVKNKWTPQFENQIVYVDMQGKQSSWTADRLEFVGRYSTLADPQGLAPGRELSNRVGAGLDPCAAMQLKLEIEPGAYRDVTITLGVAANLDAAQKMITKYRAGIEDQILDDVKQNWAKILGAVKVRTPDPAFNLMLNGWLLYQTLSCRMWARSGFYQASGAYGFRDQLQDSLALMLSRPDITREHILRSAARQFHEGDVQHWWLPSSGTGIRTRFSDDAVWLVYCVSRYVTVTGDYAILDVLVPFIDGPKLQKDEVHAFFQPTLFNEEATLYEHCVRALEQSLATGKHGLPLMGEGDWNDGMNRVGAGGRGESVWLGWMMIATLKEFVKISAERDGTKTAIWNEKIKTLTEAMEKESWDGAWYRRAFYDDGSPLGSSSNNECTIDAIAQSWAVISGAGDTTRTQTAMAEVTKQLILRKQKIALLFTPPFNKTEKDPGYIKAYPPGIRENGGQYTHGSAWSIFAFAEIGQSQKAWELFSLLNPINHALTADDVAQYRVEPYVIAADVYSVAPHIGRGGWTWYTGAAGVLYRSGIEAILGVEKIGGVLRIKNNAPEQWNEFDVSIKFKSARYNIKVTRKEDTKSFSEEAQLYGHAAFDIAMKDDGAVHTIELQFAFLDSSGIH